jgi:hypothetical protein
VFCNYQEEYVPLHLILCIQLTRHRYIEQELKYVNNLFEETLLEIRSAPVCGLFYFLKVFVKNPWCKNIMVL